MENIQKKPNAVDRTARLKKWVIMAFMTVLLALPMGSAFASSIDDFDSGLYANKKWILLSFNDGSSQLVTIPLSEKFYMSGSYVKVTGGYYDMSTSTGNTYINQTGNVANLPGSWGITIVNSNTKVYGDDTFSEDNVFFSVEPIAVKVAKTAQEVPKWVKETLVDGGLLSTGLIVLAIGLGVSLIPRLVHSFNR